MESTCLQCLLLLLVSPSCRAAPGEPTSRATPPASLAVTPSSSQFFEGKSVLLRCREEDSSAGWMVKRKTTTGVKSECGNNWGNSSGSSCDFSYITSGDTGVYWCESSEGATSGTINITVSKGDVILQSPVHPVMKGAAVTLNCTTGDDTPPAKFYKDNSLIDRDGSTGQMTIRSVSKSDEGLYRCENKVSKSPVSWLAVQGEPSKSSPPTLLLCHPVVFCAYCISALLLSVD